MKETKTPSKKQEIGEPAEDFRLTSISGQVATLRGLLEGKKGAVIVFWSSVCSHCARYDAYLSALGRQHPQLEAVAIGSRQGETAAQLRAAAAARRLTFPILHDPGGHVARRWFVQQTPRVFLVDAAGILRYRGAIDNYKYPGDVDHHAYLEPAIVQFLSGKPLSRVETASFGCAIDSVYYKFPKTL